MAFRTCRDSLTMSAHGGYCCKRRKSNNPKNLAKVDLWTSLLPRCFSTPLRRSVVDFEPIDMVPRVAARKAHQRLQEFSLATPKRLLQQYRGQSRLLAARPRLPFLARNGHGVMSDLSPLCAQKRACRQPVIIKTAHHEIALFVSSFLRNLTRAHQMGP